MGSITVLDIWSPGPPARIGLLRLEKARGSIAAARVGESGTKMKGGGGTRNPILGKSPLPSLQFCTPIPLVSVAMFRPRG